MRINKVTAVAIAAAMVVGGLTVALPAQASVPVSSSNANEIPGVITVSPTSGNADDAFFLQSIATSVGGPVGFRNASTSQIFQDGVLVGNIASLRLTTMVSTNGTNGLDGNPAFMDRSINPTNVFVSNKKLNNAALSTLHTGAFEYRYYFHALSTSLDLVNDKYISLAMTYDSVTGDWALPTVAAPTLTSLTANAAGSDVTLAATVTPAVAGTVVFKEGTTTVGTVAAVAGVATTSTTLTGAANGPHSYTATFTPTSTNYTASTSAAATVNIGALVAPVAAAPSQITVAIAQDNDLHLYLTSYSSSVALGTAAKVGGVLTAHGTLNAVVTDERQIENPAWNLTGQVGNFLKGTTVLDKKYLGWTPAVVANTLGSTAGPVVVPNVAGGLGTSSLLATGAPSYNGTVTTASAELLLNAPVNTPSGSYTATLTLTLI